MAGLFHKNFIREYRIDKTGLPGDKEQELREFLTHQAQIDFELFGIRSVVSDEHCPAISHESWLQPKNYWAVGIRPGNFHPRLKANSWNGYYQKTQGDYFGGSIVLRDYRVLNDKPINFFRYGGTLRHERQHREGYPHIDNGGIMDTKSGDTYPRMKSDLRCNIPLVDRIKLANDFTDGVVNLAADVYLNPRLEDPYMGAKILIPLIMLNGIWYSVLLEAIGKTKEGFLKLSVKKSKLTKNITFRKFINAPEVTVRSKGWTIETKAIGAGAVTDGIYIDIIKEGRSSYAELWGNDKLFPAPSK